jgi:hypothetical protein
VRGFTDETAPHQIVLAAYGVALRVCASTAEILARIEPYLPPGWRAVEDSAAHRMGIVREDDGGFTVYDGATPIITRGDLELSLVVLDSRMRMHVAIHAPSRVFIHAGVAAHRERAIVIPGHSSAGKTTLTAALVRAGAAYYSDEYAVIDDDGLVHAYPRRPSPRRLESPLPVEEVATAAGETTAADVDPPQRVGSAPPIPLALAVFTYYMEGASWHPRRIPVGRAALAMIENAVAARIRPEATMTVIVRALRGAVALEGGRGEAREVADALLRLSESVEPP